MSDNDLAPGFIRLFYTSNNHRHEDVIPIRFSGTPTPGVEPNILDNGDNVVSASGGLLVYVNTIKGFHHTSSSFTGWEIYSKGVGADPTFVFGADLSVVGTSAVALVPFGQMVTTFRTNQGGVGKLYLMETPQAPNQRIAARTTLAAPYGAFIANLLGATGIRIGRDGGKYVSGIYITTKVNDALRKRYVLNN